VAIYKLTAEQQTDNRYYKQDHSRCWKYPPLLSDNCIISGQCQDEHYTRRPTYITASQMNNNLKKCDIWVTVQRSNMSSVRQMIRTADTTVTQHVEVLLANRKATMGNGNV